ncbi:MAG: integrase domain-containing protein [Desulfovibrionales bacterium]|nr:integrase domain-containing protein [Desulfovibrionales bacterium]
MKKKKLNGNSRNFLIAKIRNSTLTGSSKTKHNNVKAAKRFASTLYQLGFKVKKWENVRNNHVAAVVEEWKKQGLSLATIKSYLSGVRAVARGVGNDRIHTENSEFGLGRRSYVARESKAVPDTVYYRIVDELRQGNEKRQRIAAQVVAMRLLGLRHEEARKIDPKLALLQDGSIYISAGTKGGRDRKILEPTKGQIDAVKGLDGFTGRHGNSWPDNMSEAAWEKYVYKVMSKMGLTIQACGASLHGLRHAFAHARYEELTNLRPPCLFSTPSDYRDAALQEHGSEWRDVHDRAVNILAHELGHNRSDVVANYIGSAAG